MAIASATPGGTRAETAPKQPATTLTSLLEVATFTIPSIGVPRALLDLANDRNTTPDSLIRSISSDAGGQLDVALGSLDATWPCPIFLGNQPEDKRRAALEWAVGLSDDGPDLGPARSDPPRVQSASQDIDSYARNAPWRAGAALLLQLSVGAARAITSPVPSSESDPEPQPVAPETATIEP